VNGEYIDFLDDFRAQHSPHLCINSLSIGKKSIYCLNA